MAWRLAKALDQLRKQVNVEFPGRRKDGDGTIGDTDHSKRSSDHNPWVDDGVVTALDLTHDPKNGFDSYRFAQSLVDNKDPRIKYIISNGKIVSGTLGPQPWQWRGYSGKNRHDHHVHISVKSDRAHYDDVDPWRYKVVPAGTKVTESYVEPPPTLKKGMVNDPRVKFLQDTLSKLPGLTLIGDGDFGTVTESVVKEFQEKHKLHADGIVGPQTWKALGVDKLP